MKISKRSIKILEQKLGLHETKARNPVPLLASLMFDIPDPYDKKLADKYWENGKRNHQRLEKFMHTKAVMGKHLPLEELVKLIEESGQDS